MSLMGWPRYLFVEFQSFIIVYVATINFIYFDLMVLGYLALRRRHPPLSRGHLETLLKSPMVPAVAVLAPAFNEAATIRESVRAMLKLNHPCHEVIVINDGSRDDTIAILIDEFKLYRSARAPLTDLPTRPVRAVYESREPLALLVIDKENGGKADSLNAGLNYARAPIVAAVDCDSLLEPEALLLAQQPFLEDERVIATGGFIRVANGCQVEHGRVTHIRTPRSLLARVQAVEYFRAFLGARVAFSLFNCLLIVSGAFGLFRRPVVLEAGGFNPATVGEDMELIVRLHHRWHRSGRPYRIVFVPDPVCWTEVPESFDALHRQRNRWQRGTVESLRLHWQMIANPRYGLLGLCAIPYFVAFEMLGPLVEITGYLFTLSGLGLGWINGWTAFLFFVASIGFGIVLSIAAVVLAEMTSGRYPSGADILRLLEVAILENLGFHQLITLWRTQGLVDGLRGKQGWGAMQRRGFRSSAAGSQPPS